MTAAKGYMLRLTWLHGVAHSLNLLKLTAAIANHRVSRYAVRLKTRTPLTWANRPLFFPVGLIGILTKRRMNIEIQWLARRKRSECGKRCQVVFLFLFNVAASSVVQGGTLLGGYFHGDRKCWRITNRREKSNHFSSYFPMWNVSLDFIVANLSYYLYLVDYSRSDEFLIK